MSQSSGSKFILWNRSSKSSLSSRINPYRQPDANYSPIPSRLDHLDHESLDLVLDGADLAHEVGGLVGGDGGGDDGAGDTAGTAESHLAGNVDVRDVLILSDEGQVEEDGEGLSVCRYQE